ncbi:MAG: polyprenyl diphosphate synthase [Candidatus Hodarchaeales archaeon]|jgi:tritrans,polycis-undecaprenyl-diphosphate synthase [geranylgeranyl-diphosphate specific]
MRNLFKQVFTLADPRNIVYSVYTRLLTNQIKNAPPPNHIALIMDGNRRFAVGKGLERTRGHEYGVSKLREIVEWVWEADVKIFTIFAFSGENFNRPKNEVDKLMQLFRENFLELVKTKEIHEHHVRIKAIGRIHSLPNDVQEAIHTAEEATKNYKERLFQIAIGYGGRAEILDAIKGIVGDKVSPEQISEELVSKYLYTNGASDPDLLIRTSGEERLSGFLLWQSAYSELYFADIYFPMFRKIDLWRAIRTYQRRDRRYGQ